MKQRMQNICDLVIEEMEKEKTNEYILNSYVTRDEMDLLSQVFVCERLKRDHEMYEATKFIKREEMKK